MFRVEQLLSAYGKLLSWCQIRLYYRTNLYSSTVCFQYLPEASIIKIQHLPFVGSHDVAP